ncbi:hypothetical protein BP5796_13097 [Coleophoma crateriformis]|uniref:Zn(2)-C6 fungal-type domain-containing protein n=1 Tax=Coleophoma crateriformis TaxID=565419 RepID=A0A3D8Q482_9HELO|nr:hypothetical protein BP5796_13097 [Coleophoma crateriformis]
MAQQRAVRNAKSCDLERPACRECARLNYNCPGYRHELDVVLKDQTASVVSRYRNQRHKPPKLPAKVACVASETWSLPKDIAYGLESHALAFLFSANTSMGARDGRTIYGLLDFLQPLYRGVTPDSPLAVATLWLAVSMMGNSGIDTSHPLEVQLMTKVIQRILTAIQDPIKSVEDETLTAVILVTYGGYLRDRRYGARSFNTVHQDGAEALVRKRGLLNFQDRRSLALFNAVRHNAVNLAISGARETRNWDLWNLHGETRLLCDSYSPATELDACGCTMVILKSRLRYEDFHTGKSLRKGLLELLQRLHSWQYSVPPEWQPRQIPFGTFSYPSPEVSYLFNQWYLLQLMVSHLKKEVEMRTHVIETPSPPSWCEMEWMNNIKASENSYLRHGSNKDNTLGLKVPNSSAYIDIDESFSGATIQLCCCSPFGSRLLGQTLDSLDRAISEAIEKLNLPSQVDLHYRDILCWTRRERDTIRQANNFK